MKFSSSQGAFIKACTMQLYKEHQDICYRYRVDLPKPVIEVVDVDSFWGKWKPWWRKISISLKLIQNHSWDVVVSVFKHEMAHQVVTDIFKSDEKHGPLFHRACGMIGVSDDFASSGGDLPRKVGSLDENDLQDENRAVLEKVRKLFALAQSKNEHESILAMQKANELIAKYNLERIRQEKKSRYVNKIIELKRKRVENYHSRICSILMDFFFVDIVLGYLYDVEADDSYRTIDIMGSFENVVMAEYVYYFLMNQLEYLWKEHRQMTRAPGRNKRSYWLGVLRGFRLKLEAQEKQRNTPEYPDTGRTTSALVLCQDQGLMHFKKKRYPRLVHRGSSSATVDAGTFNAGVSDGQNLTLHRGVTQDQGYLGRLLKE